MGVATGGRHILIDEPDDENRRTSFKKGFNEGYKKGYEKGYEEALEKTRGGNSFADVYFLKIRCECNAVNLHPVFGNKLVINEDDERRCHNCDKIISRERILSCYSRLQPNNRT